MFQDAFTQLRRASGCLQIKENLKINLQMSRLRPCQLWPTLWLLCLRLFWPVIRCGFPSCLLFFDIAVLQGKQSN